MKAALTAALCLALCACSEPPPNEETPPPEPQAAAAPAEKNTELRDAMQAPLDKARAVEAEQEKLDAERDQALEEISQ